MRLHREKEEVAEILKKMGNDPMSVFYWQQHKEIVDLMISLEMERDKLWHDELCGGRDDRN